MSQQVPPRPTGGRHHPVVPRQHSYAVYQQQRRAAHQQNRHGGPGGGVRGDLNPANSRRSLYHEHVNVTVDEQRFRHWESKILVSTDVYATTAILCLGFLVVSRSYHQMQVTAGPSMSLCFGAVLLVHLYVVKFHLSSYHTHRETALVFLRVSILMGSVLAWYTSAEKKELTVQMVIISRMIYGVYTAVGWEVNTRLSLALQVFLLVALRVVMAFAKTQSDVKLKCSPLAAVSYTHLTLPTILLV